MEGGFALPAGSPRCPVEVPTSRTRRGGRAACRIPAPARQEAGSVTAAHAGAHAHADGAPHPRSSDRTRHAPPVPPAQSQRCSHGLGGQPGGVARGQPAPLMCAGAAVIGWALVTCGDCGGPGCCGCRSARRGSGSGSPAFKGDAAAAPGMGAGGRDGAEAHHPPSLWTGGTREPELRNPGVDKTASPQFL